MTERAQFSAPVNNFSGPGSMTTQTNGEAHGRHNLAYEAALRDSARRVQHHKPVATELFDGEGRSLGTAMSEHGVATLQYVPKASSPEIESITPTELTRDDDAFPGIESSAPASVWTPSS